MTQDLSQYIGYCRVSTQRQADEGHGLERYIESLKRFGLSDDQIFWDIESGKSENRKGYNKVLSILREGKIKNLIVPCFDRFTRSIIQWEKAREEFQKLGVKVAFLEGGDLNLDTPEGVLNASMLAMFAAFTANKNSHNSKRGHIFLRSQEKALVAGFGYIKENNTFKINYDLYKDSNKSYYQIARECIEVFLQFKTLSSSVNEMCVRYGFTRLCNTKHLDFPRDHNAFKYWLLNPQLRGYISYFNKDINKQIISKDKKFNPILSEEEYKDILNILKQNKKTKLKKDTLINPLIGLCFCSACGSKMITKRSGSSKKQQCYILCRGAYPVAGHSKICNRRSSYGLKLEDLIDKVIKYISSEYEKIASFAYIAEEDNQESIEIKELRESIFKLEALQDKDLEEVISIKKIKLNKLKSTFKDYIEDKSYRLEKLKYTLAIPNFWINMSVMQLYVVFQEILERVEIDSGEVHVFLSTHLLND